MGNSAIQGGGGIYSWESGPILTQVTVSGNTVIDQGGGIYSFGYSTMSLTNVTISGNSATGEEGDGGGIYFANSAPSLTDVTIARNQANRYGGGIYAFNTFDLGFSAENRCNISPIPFILAAVVRISLPPPKILRLWLILFR